MLLANRIVQRPAAIHIDGGMPMLGRIIFRANQRTVFQLPSRTRSAMDTRRAGICKLYTIPIFPATIEYLNFVITAIAFLWLHRPNRRSAYANLTPPKYSSTKIITQVTLGGAYISMIELPFGPKACRFTTNCQNFIIYFVSCMLMKNIYLTSYSFLFFYQLFVIAFRSVKRFVYFARFPSVMKYW